MANSNQSSMVATQTSDDNNKSQPLIPELPNDVVELCLYRIPYPYQAQARSVSSSWSTAISHPSFLHSKNNLALSLPYLFVLAIHKLTARIQWQALDPRSGRWFVLPPMPWPTAASPTSFACASLPRDGKLFVLGGMRSDTGASMRTTITYRTSTNRWSVLTPMRTPRASFAAGSINGRIIAAGGNGNDLDGATVEMYDSEIDTWADVAKMRCRLDKYDAVVMGSKLYVTEGWTWPFMFSPRGGIYDLEKDTWQEMSDGMREGWTGLGVVVGERLLVISEYGDSRVKVYRPDDDTWEFVGGERFPCEAVQRPMAVGAMEGRMYVVSSGLNVGIGRVFESEGDRGRVSVEWEVVEAPLAFKHFSPSNCHVLYA